jgi:hypothetical protein
MTETPKLALKEDGFPVTALLEGAVARIIAPADRASWICLQLHTRPHESEAVQDRMSEYLPPALCQIAIAPDHAHALGLYLIDYAKRAVDPE